MVFTYEAYEKLINTIVNSGYQIADYHNYAQKLRPCVIRHDVDMSLEKAAEFSEFESKLFKGVDGIRSTYFVLLTSDFYNIFSKRSQDFLKNILSHGHEVGLHFDEKRYQGEDIKQAIFREVSLLEEMTGERVQVVSMHRPSKATLEADMDLMPLVNSYGKKFFKDFKYISDSRMCWREDVEKIVRSKQYQALHILMHPIWYGEKTVTTKECLIDFLRMASREKYDCLDENFRNLREYVVKEEIL